MKREGKERKKRALSKQMQVVTILCQPAHELAGKSAGWVKMVSSKHVHVATRLRKRHEHAGESSENGEGWNEA